MERIGPARAVRWDLMIKTSSGDDIFPVTPNTRHGQLSSMSTGFRAHGAVG